MSNIINVFTATKFKVKIKFGWGGLAPFGGLPGATVPRGDWIKQGLEVRNRSQKSFPKRYIDPKKL